MNKISTKSCTPPGLLSHYGPGHHDYTDTNMALSKVRTIIKKLSTKLKESVRVLLLSVSYKRMKAG